MSQLSLPICIAFSGLKRIARGTREEVALAARKHVKAGLPLLIFDEVTSAPIELDLRGSAQAVMKRLRDAAPLAAPVLARPAGPGRPKLGVVSREIGLLPRHWEWLAQQPGGASITLRKLVEEAKKSHRSRDERRAAQDATYKFALAMAGNLPHFEEALRALFADDSVRFGELIAAWPRDVRDHALALAQRAFARDNP